NARRQKLRIVRPVRRMTVETIFASRWMLPEKRAAFFGVTGITDIIDRKLPEHLVSFSAMRIVTRGAAHLHIAKLGAKQMRGALDQSLSLFNMAAKTRFLNAW